MVSVRVVSPSGGDPLSEAAFTAVQIDVLQEGRPQTSITDDVDGGFDVPIEINSLFTLTQARVRLTGSQTWLGAPPRFTPAASGGLVRIVVGPAGECAIIDEAELPSARSQMAVARIDTFVLLAAGEGESGPSRNVEFLDLLRLFPGELDALVNGGGAATGAFIGDSKALVVSAEGSLIYDLGSEEREEAFTALHAGGDETSTAIARAGGATVAGGGTELTWIWDDTRDYTTEVASERTRPAGVSFDNQVLVVAGGVPFGEIVEPDGTRTEVAYDDGDRFGAWIARDEDALWLIGGTDGEGEVRTDTVSIVGCPSACTPAVGPEWEGPPPSAVLDDLVLAGDAIYRVSVGAGVWQRELLWTLSTQRDGAFLVEYESGVVVVIGGTDVAGPRADVEMCWPDELLPF